MRRVNLQSVGNIQDNATRDAIREIELASAEVDLLDIANAFSTTGTFAETRVLNVTSPTLANLTAFVATFIADCKRGGQNRTT